MHNSARRQWDLTIDAMRTRLWPAPTLGIAIAFGAGIGTTQLDKTIAGSLPSWLSEILFGGGPDAAREVLGAIAGSLITVTSLTFSLTLVTLQLASSQFSPRLLRSFVSDRFVQRTLAMFLATFVYALTVLRTVRTGGDSVGVEFVPKVSVTIAFLLAIASVITLVLFLAHLVREIRVETLAANVYHDAVQALRGITSLYDPDAVAIPVPLAGAVSHLVEAADSGFVVSVDDQVLLAAAVEMDAVITIDQPPGSAVARGTPIASVRPDAPYTDLRPDDLEQLRGRIAGAISTGPERTPVQDLGYGLRQLTDVAIKALSPGINDPTTAIYALGHSAALMCELGSRDLTDELVRDEQGSIRVIIRRPDFAALLDSAVAQPRRYGAADPAVLGRLFRLLQEVAWSTSLSDRSAAVTEQLVRLKTTVAAQDFDQYEENELHRQAEMVSDALRGKWTLHTT